MIGGHAYISFKERGIVISLFRQSHIVKKTPLQFCPNRILNWTSCKERIWDA